jgi:hypothetical protein
LSRKTIQVVKNNKTQTYLLPKNLNQGLFLNRFVICNTVFF